MNHSIDPLLLPWLCHEQFLTEKLKKTAGDARLEVLGQRWDMADDWDCAHWAGTLAHQRTRVMHREIVMWAFDSPCWYARTVLPEATYLANPALFDRLQTQSLGHLIFHGTHITRVSLTSYGISAQSAEYAWLSEWMHQDTARLWVRSSEFSVLETGDTHQTHSFFLVEILLPGLMRYLS